VLKKKNTIFIPKNFYADVVLECENKIWVELFKNIKNLGRIALRAEGVTMAVGFVEEFL
jgi:translation elongation factor EF-1alpha